MFYYVGQYVEGFSGLLQAGHMEAKDERRLRRLRALTEEKGGIQAVADAAGVRWETLDQILKGVPLPQKADGTRSARSVGDVLAEKIEDAYGLGRGWFDWPFDFVDHRRYWALTEPLRAIAQDRLNKAIEELESGGVVARGRAAVAAQKTAGKKRRPPPAVNLST